MLKVQGAERSRRSAGRERRRASAAEDGRRGGGDGCDAAPVMAATGNAVGCVARREGTRRDKQAAGTSSSPPPGGRLVATTASGSRMGGGTSARWRRLRRGAWRPTAGERSWAQQEKMGGRLIPAAAAHARGEREARAEGDVLGGGGGEAGIPTRDIPVDLVGAKLLPHQPRTPVARRPSPVDVEHQVHLRLARPAAERLRRLRISDGTPHT
uniref:Uncharacterized protein n=1 Tax=Oryza glumipatula TaxID=40148 RepID=A0A0D9ZZ17_9ORYZ